MTGLSVEPEGFFEIPFSSSPDFLSTLNFYLKSLIKLFHKEKNKGDIRIKDDYIYIYIFENESI